MALRWLGQSIIPVVSHPVEHGDVLMLAGRECEEGGVRIDGEKVSDRSLKLEPGFEGILQVGKLKFCRASVT